MELLGGGGAISRPSRAKVSSSMVQDPVLSVSHAHERERESVCVRFGGLDLSAENGSGVASAEVAQFGAAPQ